MLVTHLLRLRLAFAKGKEKRRVNPHLKAFFCGEIYESLMKP